MNLANIRATLAALGQAAERGEFRRALQLGAELRVRFDALAPTLDPPTAAGLLREILDRIEVARRNACEQRARLRDELARLSAANAYLDPNPQPGGTWALRG